MNNSIERRAWDFIPNNWTEYVEIDYAVGGGIADIRAVEVDEFGTVYCACEQDPTLTMWDDLEIIQEGNEQSIIEQVYRVYGVELQFLGGMLYKVIGMESY